MAVLQEHVARKAGVSISTVSRVFTGSRPISKNTRKKVMQVAKELGFAANSSASALATGKSNNIGLAVWHFSCLADAYFGSIISGIAQLCDINNKGLMFGTSVSEGKKEPEYIRIAKERCVDGLIVADHTAKEKDLLMLSESGIPVVLIDRKDSKGKLPSVCVDYRAVVNEAVSSLIELGHKRIAVISPNDCTVWLEYREKMYGYVDALKKYDIPFCQELIFTHAGDANVLDCITEAVDSFEGLASPPTAYISFADMLTTAMFRVLLSHGLRIPQDVSAIGINASNGEGSGAHAANIIQFPGVEVGKKAFELLNDCIDGVNITKHVLVGAEYRKAGSCAPPGR